jgi:hypothetical protein
LEKRRLAARIVRAHIMLCGRGRSGSMPSPAFAREGA